MIQNITNRHTKISLISLPRKDSHFIHISHLYNINFHILKSAKSQQNLVTGAVTYDTIYEFIYPPPVPGSFSVRMFGPVYTRWERADGFAEDDFGFGYIYSIIYVASHFNASNIIIIINLTNQPSVFDCVQMHKHDRLYIIGSQLNQSLCQYGSNSICDNTNS